MRALRSEDVYPLCELSAKPMKTKFGTKQRPEFKIVEWRLLGRGENTKIEAVTPAPKAIGKPVKPVSVRDELDDEIPF